MSKWVIEHTKNWSEDWRDEETGRHSWGVTDMEGEGGYEMFNTKQEAIDYVREMKRGEA